ncbi:MAG TPA: alkaline phosphatase family protein [Sandaracinaceae bacterium]
MSRRVLVVGLDCAPPALCFDRLARAMPALSALRRRGAWGALRSTVPPITVPAWACMVSGRDPGELGLYGFRKRVPGSYELVTGDARDVQVPRVWDVLGEAGKKVCVLYVPPTSPPSAVRGQLVSCFLTPSPDAPCTHPPELAAALEARFGPHAPDVGELRHGDEERLLDELYASARQHFGVARALWAEERPDFLMMVEMGTDRLHHAMWTHLDPAHPAHDPSHPLVREARDYYAFLDAQLASLAELAGDDTAVLVVSDHGARRTKGAICVNEHLRRTGWLALREEPAAPTPLRIDDVDWSRTRAWAEAGYYARVFVNVRGREPQGIVPPEELDETVEALRAELEALSSEGGEVIEVRAHRPAELYRAVRGHPPELLVFFGDLDYRALSLVGTRSIVVDGDDRRPDGANHDWDGIFVAAGAGVSARGELAGLSIFDVGPTILSLMGVAVPDGWLGRDRSAG